MTPVHLHHVAAHGPVFWVPVAAGLLAWGTAVRNPALIRAGAVLTVAAAVLAGLAYLSGPPAAETLGGRFELDRELVLRHALLGRATAAGLLVLAAAAVGLLKLPAAQLASGEPLPRRTGCGLSVGLTGLWYVVLWTAHLGGHVFDHGTLGETWRVFP